MQKLISLFAVVVVMGLSGMAMASPSFFGTSGLMLTPDDSVLSTAGFSANYNGLSLDNQAPNLIGASVGATSGLELGLTRLDPDVASGDIDTIVNVKYMALGETSRRPSLVLGAVDLTGEIDPGGNGGFYLLLGKNLTSLVSSMTGSPLQPLHGYVGFGTGIYDGPFVGLSWELTPKIKLMGEFINGLDVKNVLNKKSMFNVGATFRLNESLSGNLSMLDGNDFAYGIAYSKSVD